MERIKIDIYISDLLYSYDCVIVPDFGGFVTNYAPAKIQAVQHKLIPPSKKISFNKNLINNDGLLVNHIAERKSISYEEANQLIRGFVNQSIEGLKKGDRIKIEKVGTLYLDTTQKVQFKAVDKNDYLLESFGLASLRATPIKREVLEERIEKKVREQQKTIKKRPIYWAAAMLLVLFASSLFLNTQFQWMDTSTYEHALLGFSEKTPTFESRKSILSDVKEEPKQTFELDPTAIELKEEFVPFITASGERTSLYVDSRPKKRINKVENTKVKATSAQFNTPYHVMGGCFSNYSNATSLVDKLQKEGFEAQLLGTYKKLYAVSFGSFTTKEQAIKMLADIRNNQNPNAWLLKKSF